MKTHLQNLIFWLRIQPALYRLAVHGGQRGKKGNSIYLRGGREIFMVEILLDDAARENRTQDAYCDYSTIQEVLIRNAQKKRNDDGTWPKAYFDLTVAVERFIIGK